MCPFIFFYKCNTSIRRQKNTWLQCVCGWICIRPLEFRKKKYGLGRWYRWRTKENWIEVLPSHLLDQGRRNIPYSGESPWPLGHYAFLPFAPLPGNCTWTRRQVLASGNHSWQGKKSFMQGWGSPWIPVIMRCPKHCQEQPRHYWGYPTP